MKNYKEVVRRRYDRQKYDSKGIINNPYAPVNPCGFYGEFKAAQILYEFVNMIRNRGEALDKIKICDCGCGGGIKTRFLAELLGNPDQIYGVEYSRNRLQYCENMNGAIHYSYMDLTEDGGLPFNIQFDGITVFVVFTHFSSEEEIITALKNIHGSLKRKGLFLWYELNADSHEDGKKKNADQWGFSEKEMDKYATKAGFRLVKEFSIYTKIPLINASTIYLIKNIKRIWLMELLEKLPFKKNNLIRIYCKE